MLEVRDRFIVFVRKMIATAQPSPTEKRIEDNGVLLNGVISYPSPLTTNSYFFPFCLILDEVAMLLTQRKPM